MKTVSGNEASKNLVSLMVEVTEERTPILITRKNNAACVLISLAEYESLEETAYLQHSPANARHLIDSMDELRSPRNIA